MAKKTIAWHKERNYEVPYNPCLRGNPSIELREIEVDEGIAEVAPVEEPAATAESPSNLSEIPKSSERPEKKKTAPRRNKKK